MLNTTIDFSQYDKEVKLEENFSTILHWRRKAKKDEEPDYPAISKDVTVYHNCTTGKQSINRYSSVVEPGVPSCSYLRRSNKIFRSYYKATSDNKYLCIIICSFNTHSIKEGETRHWQEECRYYMDKNKNTYYPAHFTNCDTTGKYYGGYLIKEKDLPYRYSTYPSMLSVAATGPHDDSSLRDFQTEAWKIFPRLVTLESNKIVELMYPSRLDMFMCYKEVLPKQGPKQKKIDELVSYPLEAVSIPKLSKIQQAIWHWERSSEMLQFATLSKVKDGIVCLRTFTFSKENTELLYESCRIYVEGNKVYVCKPNNFGTYVSMPLSSKDCHWKFPIMDFNPCDLKGTRLEYLGKIIDEIDPDNRCLAIKFFLQNEMAEQLYKNGFAPFIRNIIKNCSYDVNKALNSMLTANNSEKSFYKFVGLNKHQVEVFSKYFKKEEFGKTSCMSIVSYVKKCFEVSNIADIDDNTFDAAFKYVSSYFDFVYDYYYFRLANCFKMISDIYSVKTAANISESIINILKKENKKACDRWHSSSKIITETYYDYLSMVGEMHAARDFRPQFETIDDIKEMHDAALVIYNAKKDEYQTAAFSSAVEKCKKYEYRDENYAILVPKAPSEVANEGLTLHHCVKTYINRIMRGETNILFLRKTSEIDKPFFTIELSNSGVVEQIHGFGNRNISTEPDIKYFVNDWVEKKKLKKSNFNKVR